MSKNNSQRDALVKRISRKLAKVGEKLIIRQNHTSGFTAYRVDAQNKRQVVDIERLGAELGVSGSYVGPMRLLGAAAKG